MATTNNMIKRYKLLRRCKTKISEEDLLDTILNNNYCEQHSVKKIINNIVDNVCEAVLDDIKADEFLVSRHRKEQTKNITFFGYTSQGQSSSSSSCDQQPTTGSVVINDKNSGFTIITNPTVLTNNNGRNQYKQRQQIEKKRSTTVKRAQKSKKQRHLVVKFNKTAKPVVILENEKQKTAQRKTAKILYCYCNRPYNKKSSMIGCDGSNCQVEWFHFDCVGIKKAPRGKWYCPDCQKIKPKNEKKPVR
ncbi:Zinc finger, FYVE/PHD-type,Zinc finger, PHD-type,Zinc finger, RING/FYVE/PHD-type,Zinc finger, PHD- [Cinara cedri]|uniref:Zinc finger, FYVE/PHD-type,Zinc finger, PHD-type,Zinc finger, RING/FYVE/PHD-type,Zinc finger, PHD n=1 Tax=Cinara cedri TaxID=506608 RepID=A0A5E4N9R0_9HEMI|nr:Zinc finger, FYVE/PHD-type,Zinc finger, PHD-type,Zinc finger, RING/FYVE/PHD-type,Zinc finger, PHD- [Cinara cedri]